MALENPLNSFATYNYNFEFGVLNARQANGEQSYKDGAAVTIIKSGGFSDKSITTAIEDDTGTNVEFFIDNVNASYLPTANPGTSFSNAIQIDFQVIEPGSVGLFFQSLSIATEQALGVGVSYLNAPFLFKCTFKGFDDNNNTKILPSHNLVLSLINVTFEVTAAGAMYQVSAIPWNHKAFFDQICRIPNDAALKGGSVGEILSWGEFSLEEHLNKIETEKARQDTNYIPHEFRIDFPQDISLLNSDGAYVTTSRQYEYSLRDRARRQRDIAEGQRQTAVSDARLIRQANQPRVTALEQTLSGFADPFEKLQAERNLAQINRQIPNPRSIRANAVINENENELGQALITDDQFAYGNIPFKTLVDGQIRENPDGTKVITRGSMTFDPDNREFQFGVGEKIEKIIEGVLLGSAWGKAKADELAVIDGFGDQGEITWFKIHSRSEIIDASMMAKTGNPAMRYTYIVTPQSIHSSRITGLAPQTYSPQIKKAVKHYNYVYTGLNTDIIDFTFNINNAFYKEMTRLGSQGGQDTMQNSGNRAVIEPTSQSVSSVGPGFSVTASEDFSNPSGNVATGSGTTSPSGGSGDDSGKRRIAEHFNKLILNSDQDNVMLDLRIWGDPFYFTEADFGNNHPQSSAIGVTDKGHLDITRGEVFVLISFRTSVDFVGNLTALDPANAFSGVYKIVTFRNEFANGTFTQTLNLMKMPGQTLEDQNLSNSLVLSNLYSNPNLVLGNINRKIASQSVATQALLQKTEYGINSLLTGFSNNQIDKIPELFSGTAINDIAQNVFSAFNQINLIANTLNRTIGALSSILPSGFGGQLNSALGQLNQGLPAAAQQLQNQIPGLFNNITSSSLANAVLAGSQDINGDISRVIAGGAGLQAEINAAIAAGQPQLAAALSQAQAQLPITLQKLSAELPDVMQKFQGQLPAELANAVQQMPASIQKNFDKIPGYIQQATVTSFAQAAENFQSGAAARITRQFGGKLF